MNSYTFGRDVGQDLDGLWEYVSEESVEAAERLIAGLFAAFEALARNPGMGLKRKDLTTFPVLFWPVGNYLVIYRAKKTLVQIVAVVHGKRDIPTFLRRQAAE